MIPVKICGITSLKNASMAVNFGASALGMIFYRGSLRYVEPYKTEKWISQISGQVKKVGVFVNEEIEVIQSIVKRLSLDYVQLHGDESPEFCAKINKPIIKVIRVDNYVDNSLLKEYNVNAFLMDTYKEGLPGGTGEKFNWNFTSSLKTETPIILSGGLNAENIIEGIEKIHPAAVDLSSGVESSPGKKDQNKMKQLFNVLKDTNVHTNLFNKSILRKHNGV